MTQVTGPIIATRLVLLAVFVPVALLPGLTGQLHRQFAVTISAAVVLSSINALTLSPALCATLLRPPSDRRRGPLAYFARALDASRDRYARVVAWLVRRLGLAQHRRRVRPVRRDPDHAPAAGGPGCRVRVDVKLPEAAALERTEEVMAQVREILDATAGVKDVIAVSGFSILSGTLLANTGASRSPCSSPGTSARRLSSSWTLSSPGCAASLRRSRWPRPLPSRHPPSPGWAR
jgi:multidrug efflux pump subunit AcrB